MTALDDPFDVPSAVKADSPVDSPRRGRYWLPRRDGTKKPWGWMRVTNLVAAYSDQYALRVWEHEQVMRAATMDAGIIAALAAEMDGWAELGWDLRKNRIEHFLELCKGVTGGDAGSKFGNAKHQMVEDFHAGLPVHHPDAGSRRHLELYVKALKDHKLRVLEGMQERVVLVESLEVAGKIDNVVEEADGTLRIADLKSQKRFWTTLETEAQLASYAHADAMWDRAAGVWADMPPVARDLGVVLWMPRITEDGQPRVDVLDANLAAGWATAMRASEVVKDRKRAKSTANVMRRRVSMEERYAAMFAAVASVAEGRALVAEVKHQGLWDLPLADCAKLALDRLTKN